MSNDPLAILVQCAGSQRRLAAILGISEEQISRWRHGRYDVPMWVVVLAEAMDRLPRRDWPERWTPTASDSGQKNTDNAQKSS